MSQPAGSLTRQGAGSHRKSNLEAPTTGSHTMVSFQVMQTMNHLPTMMTPELNQAVNMVAPQGAMQHSALHQQQQQQHQKQQQQQQSVSMAQVIYFKLNFPPS